MKCTYISLKNIKKFLRITSTRRFVICMYDRGTRSRRKFEEESKNCLDGSSGMGFTVSDREDNLKIDRKEC